MRNTNSFSDTKVLYKNMKGIKNLSRSMAEERLAFLDGTALGDVDIFIESGETRRKVRRIVEKRVCQDLNARWRHSGSNDRRYVERRRVSNQMRNIYGKVPEEVIYLRMAC